ncbi:PREDICTED: high-affinity nitrate transporter 3.2-like [Camelina sativa]|uniref:High-affinity nitrate transporter n=1 Tax=Camelina sativa TaxID=90675 RepID=A0ABM1QJB4_CAMSA|nr:PREDICTED: high-affinity nitrate transporter 3.2-like [Camelina sativa]
MHPVFLIKKSIFFLPTFQNLTMAIHTLLFAASLLIFSFIESSCGGNKDKVFTGLQNSLEVTAKPVQDSVVLEAGKDMVTIKWKLKSSAKVDADDTFKKIQVKLCYAPISQVDRPWRKTHNELFKDKTCPHEIVSKSYDKTPQSLDWTVDLDIPTGTYFVRAYGIDGDGQEVAYGQSSDEGRKKNLFSVQAISGGHVSLDIASILFSIFSVVSLLVFFVKEKKKAKLEQRE